MAMQRRCNGCGTPGEPGDAGGRPVLTCPTCNTQLAAGPSTLETPTVSVIVTTHSWDRWGYFCDAIRSVASQTYPAIELVCPFDDDRDMARAARGIIDTTENDLELEFDAQADASGIAAARNRGAELATGDVYAFLDDDCVANSEWVAQLVEAYRDGAFAAGGPAYPDWPSDSRPWYLPDRFDWLVGGGPYYNHETVVRNTYGCNLSFRADVFDLLGGFDESVGKHAAVPQGEEPELCRRLRDRFDRGVRYCPTAAVDHCVFPKQLSIPGLLRRAYEQGQTKRALGVDDGETNEIVAIARDAVSSLPHESVLMGCYTAATAAGYAFGGRNEWSEAAG